MDLEIIAQAFWIIIPAYVANGCAVLVGGGKPIDFGKKCKDGKRILGDGKTWRGLLVGTFLGMTVGFALSTGAIYIDQWGYGYIGLTDFYRFPYMIVIIFSICFGALMGDISESFFKRRIGRERGEDWIPFDQIDFLLGALILSFILAGILQVTNQTENNWFSDNLTIWHILFLLVITPLFHFLGNLLHRMGKAKKTA